MAVSLGETTKKGEHMMRIAFVLASLAALVLVVAAPVSAGPPADGNGNQEVVPVDAFFPIACNGDVLDVGVTGWLKIREFRGEGNRNIALTIVHLDITFTNPETGETYTYLDVGPDRSYIDSDGNFVLTITGRPSDPLFPEGGFSLRGHVVLTFDVNTFELLDVSVHGNQGPTPDAAACAALT